MDKKDKLYIGLYNDYYGALLTDYQRSLIDSYYNKDMSLGEMADELGISPQGVRDALCRAEKALVRTEEKLGFVAKTAALKNILDEIGKVEGAKALADKAKEVLDS